MTHSLSFGSCSIMTLRAQYYVWSLTLLDLPIESGMGIRLETQLRGLKTAIFNSSPLFLPLPPSNSSKETLYFRGKFIVCVVRASLKSWSFFLQTSLLLGVVSNVGSDSLARRNLSFILCYYWKHWCSIWAFYSGTSLCHSWHGWALEDRICSVGLCHCTMPWIVICLAPAFSWLSCNSLERASNTVGCTLTGFYRTWYW